MVTPAMLKSAWEAVAESGVPSEVQGIAFQAVLESLRGGSPAAADSPPGDNAKPPKPERRKPAGRKPAGTHSSSSDSTTALADVGDADAFFDAIVHETGVEDKDLRDLLHVEDGKVELKVASRDLGSNNKAKTTAVATLLAGAVFGGTSHHRLPFSEVYEVCKAKRCFDSNNASSYLKSLPGFAPVGSGKAQALTPKSGWETEFSKAVAQVLGKPLPTDG